MGISVVINTRNAAETLSATLQSVSFADEIIVCDMHSSDDTAEIAKKAGAVVLKTSEQGFVEPARNIAVAQAKQAWILVVDADEVIPKALADLCRRIAQKEIGPEMEADCYYVARQNIFADTWIEHAGWWPDYQMRFFKLGCVTWSEEIHSVPITRGIVKQLPAQLKFAIEHHNYKNLEEFVSRMNRYSSIQATQDTTTVEPATILRTFKNELLSRYFAQEGYKDKVLGLNLSILQATSDSLAKMKRVESMPQVVTQQSEKDLDSVWGDFAAEIHYWIATKKIQQSRGLAQLYWRLRRKFLL